MPVAVVTVASGGLPVVDVSATTPTLGLPIIEASNGRGIAVTTVTAGKPGLAVTYAVPLVITYSDTDWPSGANRPTFAA